MIYKFKVSIFQCKTLKLLRTKELVVEDNNGLENARHIATTRFVQANEFAGVEKLK